MTAPLTVTLRLGLVVLAKLHKGTAHPKTFANVAQARRAALTAALETGEAWDVFGRYPFFAGKVAPVDAVAFRLPVSS